MRTSKSDHDREIHAKATEPSADGLSAADAVLRQATVSGTSRLDKSHVKGLFERYYASLVRFLMKKLGSEQEAQDIAQEAFAKLLGLGDEKVVNHMQAYLFRIANNLAIDRLRQKRKLQALHQAAAADNDDLTPPSSLENATDARQQLLRIQALLQQLPPKCRMAFLLYKFENLSYLEIGNKMNLSESMVRKYVLRAIRFFAESLDAEL